MRTEDRFWIVGAVLVWALSGVLPAWAQSSTTRLARPAYSTTKDLTDVRPFQAWITDCVITQGVDIEPVVRWGNDDDYNRFSVDAMLAIWAANDLEIGAMFGFTSINWDTNIIDDSSGPNDVTLYGRYRFTSGPDRTDPTFAGGIVFDIPVGDEDVLESTFDFGVFGAFRIGLENGIDMFANAAIESVDLPRLDDRKNGIRLGGGAIIPLTEEWAFIGEGNLGTADDSFTLTGGFDYELPPGGHLRTSLNLGLDDGSDDIGITLSFVIPVY